MSKTFLNCWLLAASLLYGASFAPHHNSVTSGDIDNYTSLRINLYIVAGYL